MDIILFLLGGLAILVGIIMFIVSCIRKTKKRISGFVMLGGFIAFSISLAIPTTQPPDENTSVQHTEMPTIQTQTESEAFTENAVSQNSAQIEEAVKTEELPQRTKQETFTPTLESSIGAVKLENGQIIEYSSDSIAELAYTYENTTEYNRGDMAAKYDDTYVQIFGSITEITSNGVINVLCSDSEATDAAGKLWPIQAYGYVRLVDEQSELLSQLQKDKNVVIYAKVNMDSYENFLGMQTFNCYDGILLAYENARVDVPIITSVTKGIQMY